MTIASQTLGRRAVAVDLEFLKENCVMTADVASILGIGTALFHMSCALFAAKGGLEARDQHVFAL